MEYNCKDKLVAPIICHTLSNIKNEPEDLRDTEFINLGNISDSLIKLERNSEENVSLDIPSNTFYTNKWIKAELKLEPEIINNLEGICGSERKCFEDDMYKCAKLCPKNIDSLIKIEEDDDNESEQKYYVKVEDLATTSELILKEDLETNENSGPPNDVRQENQSPEIGIMYNCVHCDLKTLDKYRMKTHLLANNIPRNNVLFKCTQCDYESPRKYNLKSHFLGHKNPKERKMHKCEQCEYETFRVQNLNQHLIKHKKPEKINMFKCKKCEYQAKTKHRLKKHLLLYKNHSLKHRALKRPQMYTCHQCEYQTRRSSSFKGHLLTHKDPEKLDKFKCFKCKFQTIRKEYLIKHLLRHQKYSSDVIVQRGGQKKAWK